MTTIYAGFLIFMAVALGIMVKAHDDRLPLGPSPSKPEATTPVHIPLPPASPPVETHPIQRPPQVPPQTPKTAAKPAPPVLKPEPPVTVLSPTIYFISKFHLEEQICTPEQKRNLMGLNDQVLFQVCRTAYRSCVMEGTCVVQDEDGNHLLNFGERRPDGSVRFVDISDNECRYGFGVRAICLDPFYTVAADPAFHKPGEVIFVEKVRGTKLPNGDIHNGYFIVRDAGKRILGPHRFDFFTGDLTDQNPSNPFSKMGLGSQEAKFVYKRVPKIIAEDIRKKRGYPGTNYE